MAGSVSGVGTTYGLPNYHGELFALSPADTPLLSAAGGLTGGGQTDSAAFEWQTYDLRDASSRPRLEGADAPTAEERVRGNIENVCQIFHEAVATSYTKAAAVGQYATPGSAPFYSAGGSPNPVGNEHTWQVAQAVKQIARDVNYCFWNGTKVKPENNSTARATQGIIGAASANTIEKKAKLTSISAATDTLTVTHDLVAADGDKFVFTDVGASTAVVPGRIYYVASNSTTASFKVKATPAGSAITVGTATMAGYPLKAANTITVDNVNTLLQQIFDAGGLGENATIFTSSGNKRRLSAAYANEYGKADALAGSRNVGGVAVETIITDFGVLNVVIDRALPGDAISVVSLGQVRPVFLNIPGKGVLFEEELAKTGASDKTQIYGEIGLEYGNPLSHGVYRGLFS